MAPAFDGLTGKLFTTDSRTLERGELVIGFSAANFDQLYPEAPELRPKSDRPFRGFDVDRGELRLFLSYGLTDDWEITVAQPFILLNQNIGDVAGYVEGYPRVGEFVESGTGRLTLGTKLRLLERHTLSLAVSARVELPTGESGLGITSGATDLTIGTHLDYRRLTWSTSYRARGDRSAADDPTGRGFDLADELRIDAAYSWESARVVGVEWIAEVNGAVLIGGERTPDGPLYLSGGGRYRFAQSCLVLDLALNYNVAMALTDNPSHPLGGLINLSCSL